MSNITSILAEKNVPAGLTSSIVEHFKILYKKISAFDEESVLSGLPRQISNRISIAIHNETMNRIKLFSYIDNQSVALFIFNILQPCTFQPGQAIMKEGTAALEITFLESGTAIAFKALKDNKKRAYFLNWKTGSKSKTSTLEQVYPEQCSQLEFTSTRSAMSMRKDRPRGISIHNKVAPVSDSDTIVDAMHSIVPSASELDDSVHDGSIVENDDQDYSFFSEKIREKLVDIKDDGPDFTDDEIIELGYEPVARYSACDFFGHASILKEANNHATVMALRACSTYTLKKSEIVKLAMNNPPISMILQAAIGKAIHSLRHSKGKEMVRQKRAKFLTTIKSKHIGYKNTKLLFW
jgi:CRP-like cAMP-binding protein